jgi:hypothetical protein
MIIILNRFFIIILFIFILILFPFWCWKERLLITFIITIDITKWIILIIFHNITFWLFLFRILFTFHCIYFLYIFIISLNKLFLIIINIIWYIFIIVHVIQTIWVNVMGFLIIKLLLFYYYFLLMLLILLFLLILIWLLKLMSDAEDWMTLLFAMGILLLFLWVFLLLWLTLLTFLLLLRLRWWNVFFDMLILLVRSGLWYSFDTVFYLCL